MNDQRTIQVDLYPNPADEFVYLNYLVVTQDVPELRVFDIYGKLMIQQVLTETESIFKLNTSDWIGGNYVLRLTAGDQVAIKKFVVIN
jgi:hypothetical protein